MTVLSQIDHELPRCADMLAPTLHRCAQERLPIFWDARHGRVALVVLDQRVDPIAGDELELALGVYRALERGLLVIR